MSPVRIAAATATLIALIIGAVIAIESVEARSGYGCRAYPCYGRDGTLIPAPPKPAASTPTPTPTPTPKPNHDPAPDADEDDHQGCDFSDSRRGSECPNPNNVIQKVRDISDDFHTGMCTAGGFAAIVLRKAKIAAPLAAWCAANGAGRWIRDKAEGLVGNNHLQSHRNYQQQQQEDRQRSNAVDITPTRVCYKTYKTVTMRQEYSNSLRRYVWVRVEIENKYQVDCPR